MVVHSTTNQLDISIFDEMIENDLAPPLFQANMLGSLLNKECELVALWNSANWTSHLLGDLMILKGFCVCASKV